MRSSIKEITGRLSLTQISDRKLFFTKWERKSPRVTYTTNVTSQDLTGLKAISQMPGPRNYPIIGGLIPCMITRKPKFDPKKSNLFWDSMHNEFGPIFRFKIPGMPWTVFISDVDDIKQLNRITIKNPIRESIYSLQKVREHSSNKHFFENKKGISIENNEEWWRVRSRVQTPMLKPKNVAKYLPQIDEVALHMTDRIQDLQQLHGEMPENFIQDLYKWALESVCLVVLSRRLGCFDPDLSKDSVPMQMLDYVLAFGDALNSTELGAQWWRFVETKPLKDLRKAHNGLLDILIPAIKETEEMLKNRAQDAEPSLMETLLLTDGLTQKDVITLMLDMVIAGIETTSCSMGFTLYCLARNKDAQRKLQAEIDSIMGDGKEPLNENHLARFIYLKVCVKESFRKFPIVMGQGRILASDAGLGGYLVPKGYQVVTTELLNSSKEKYFARPSEYLPERWARDQPLGAIHPFVSLPFSHGPRMCIGRRIAEQEIYVLLARIFHRFDVDYKYDDIDIITRLVSLPSKPLKFEFTERK